MLLFSLLGQVTLSQHNQRLSNFRSQKEAALLIYLAHTQKQYPRDLIADLLWEGSSTKQSLTNLRTVLSRLRKQVGDALLVTRKTVELADHAYQAADSAILLRALDEIGPINSAGKAEALEQILNQYQGDFLPDFYLDKAPQFNEWVMTTRQLIRRHVLAAYAKLGQYAFDVGDSHYGIRIAQRWLEVDSLDESAHALLLRVFIAAGQIDEATKHHNDCVNLLRTELGIEPPRALASIMKGVRPVQAEIGRMVPTARHKLPVTHDPFFGRQASQEEIHTRFDQPWCRLVTLVGLGGVGKTRLATMIAHTRHQRYRDGAWWVALAEIDPDDEDICEAIAVEIATILDLRLTGSASPETQLLDHLRDKQLFLVLDNFDFLVEDGVDLILKIIQQCEGIQLLITSREALQIRAEWVIPLAGLHYPTDYNDDLPSDAVALFLARQAQQSHHPVSAEALTAVRSICHFVEGLPLAIELAAALTHHVPVESIAADLRESFDSLTSYLRDIPKRHRGLNIVFEMSWQTLTPELQGKLARLATFRGGFTIAAAQAVTASRTPHLIALSEKSLLRYHASIKRYTIHPVIQAYAAARRPEDDQTESVHSRYFLTYLAEQTEILQKDRPQRAMSLIEPDIDNVRLAWQTALQEKNTEGLRQALTSLSTYYQLRGLAHEAVSIMCKTAVATESGGKEDVRLSVSARLEEVRFQNRIGRYQLAANNAQKAVERAYPFEDYAMIAMGHVWWGEALWRLAKYEQAQEKLQYALELGQESEDSGVVGWCYHQLGIIDDIQGAYDRAYDYLQNACEIWRSLDQTQNLSNSLNSLGVVCYHKHDLNGAQQTLDQALALCKEIGNRYVEATLLNNLSLIAFEKQDYEGSRYYLQNGLKLAEGVGNLQNQGDIYVNLGRTFSKQGEDGLAIMHFQKALQLAESINNRLLITSALTNIADARFAQQQTKKAEDLYSRALVIAREDQLQMLECQILFSLAQTVFGEDRQQAQNYYQQAVQHSLTTQNPFLVQRAKEVESQLFAAKG